MLRLPDSIESSGRIRILVPLNAEMLNESQQAVGVRRLLRVLQQPAGVQTAGRSAGEDERQVLTCVLAAVAQA